MGPDRQLATSVAATGRPAPWAADRLEPIRSLAQTGGGCPVLFGPAGGPADTIPAARRAVGAGRFRRCGGAIRDASGTSPEQSRTESTLAPCSWFGPYNGLRNTPGRIPNDESEQGFGRQRFGRRRIRAGHERTCQIANEASRIRPIRFTIGRNIERTPSESLTCLRFCFVHAISWGRPAASPKSPGARRVTQAARAARVNRTVAFRDRRARARRRLRGEATAQARPAEHGHRRAILPKPAARL